MNVILRRECGPKLSSVLSKLDRKITDEESRKVLEVTGGGDPVRHIRVEFDGSDAVAVATLSANNVTLNVEKLRILDKLDKEVGRWPAWQADVPDDVVAVGDDACWVSPIVELRPSAVVVTRHPALIHLLRERGLVGEDTKVVEHATVEDVAGKHVFGVLPMELAAHAARLTTIPLRMEPEDRGKELGLERLREIAGEARTFKVTCF